MSQIEAQQPAHGKNISPFEEICLEIDELYGESKNWTDGEPITTQQQHDAADRLYGGLHEAGKKADALRVEEKKPLDEQVDAIQARYNPYIQPKKGKVDIAKGALNTLLAAWRNKQAIAKQALADKARKDAEEIEAAARQAFQDSQGNAIARADAERLADQSRAAQKEANKLDKQANTGNGLRTVWKAKLVDPRAAINHFWKKNEKEFIGLVELLAFREVHQGARTIPGFEVIEEKKAV